MQSELDDLLDEVNGYFDSKGTTSKPTTSYNKSAQSDSYSYNQGIKLSIANSFNVYKGSQRTNYASSIQTSNLPKGGSQSKASIFKWKISIISLVKSPGFDDILNSPDAYLTAQTQQKLTKVFPL